MAKRARNEPARSQGVYMISVAAELAGMHPQTLRIYEQRGLISPKRSPGRTRLYSQEDVERLRRIQDLTEMGMNLAGVERVFELEKEVERMQRRFERLSREATEAQRQLRRELERMRREMRAEIVRWEPPGSVLMPPRRRAQRPSDGRTRRAG